jgi:transcriptional regulator with XRE-family HTH domain
MAGQRRAGAGDSGLDERGWRSMIRGERIRAELTQQALAARAGVSVETVRKYESGLRTPSRPRLLGLLQSMSVPRTRAAAILEAAGYVPEPEGSGAARRSSRGGDLDAAGAAMEQYPWPRLIVDERLQLARANLAARGLLGLAEAPDGRADARRHLLGVLVHPDVAGHVVNLDACLAVSAAAVRRALGRVASPADAGAIGDGIVAECATSSPSFSRRLLDAWEKAQASEPAARASSLEMVWLDDDDGQARFVATSSPVDALDGYRHLDLHPADAASHAILERILSAGPVRIDSTPQSRMRQSSLS